MNKEENNQFKSRKKECLLNNTHYVKNDNRHNIDLIGSTYWPLK